MADYQGNIDYLRSLLHKECKVVDTYGGVFNQKIVKKFATRLSRLSSKFLVTQRRIFYVFVELAQNVGFYAEEKVVEGKKEIGLGELVIYETDKTIGFIVGNTINNSALNVLRRKWKIINSMDRISLREFKRHQRNLIPGTNGGAHIGLIMVALTTRDGLNINILEIDKEKSFLTINVQIEKIKEKI